MILLYERHDVSRRHVYYSFGLGAISVPAVDFNNGLLQYRMSM